MLGIQHHQAELLDRPRTELRQQIRGRVAWRRELQPRRRTPEQRPPPQLDRGEHLSRLRAAHPVETAKLVDRRPRHAVEAARGLENVVRKRQGVRSARAAADDNRNKLVVAQPGGAETEQLLARAIVRRQGFYGQDILKLMVRRVPIACVALLLCSLPLFGCATPPTREMDQAQGSIDAARAAGADRYATEQYEAAVKALQNAQTAVEQRDYRLALNYALDSRDRAQRAAKEAASQQAVLRSAAERQLVEVTASLDQARQALKGAESARVPRQSLTAARTALANAESSLQKAGTSIHESNYKVSQNQLAESAKNLEAAMAEIETAMKSRPRRR